MKTKWMGVLLLPCSSAMAQTVFNTGVDVSGRTVQGVGLIDITNTNLLWGSMVPSLAQLAGLNPANGASLTSVFLVPLRPAWLETDGIYAHTSNGLTFYDENGSAVLSIRAGAIWSAGGSLSNLTPIVSTLPGGRLATAMLPAGGTWDAGGMTLNNVTVSGNGAGLRGISVQSIDGLGSAAQRNMTEFASSGQGDLADTALQEDSYAPDLGASITTNFVTNTNAIMVTGTSFPATLPRYNADNGQYYFLGGSPDLLLNIAWTDQQSAMGDYWAHFNGTWYLAYTSSGAPNTPTGTLTAVNTVYMWGSGTLADAAYSWNNTSSVWTNMAGYWIATNTATQANELWGPSGNSNLLLTTSTALNGAWATPWDLPQLNWSGGFWGNIALNIDRSGNATFTVNPANALKITPDGILHYLAQWNGNKPQADIIGGQIDSGTLVGTVNLYNGFLVQGTENDGFYAWNGTDRYELNGYFITVDGNNVCNLYDPSSQHLYYASYGTANTTGPWTTDHGSGECHSGIWSGQAFGTTAYGATSTTIPSSFYPDQTGGVAQFSNITLQTNKLSFISGLATTALQPGASLTNLTGQLLVTALPTGTDKTWDAGGLTLNNVTVSGNGMGLTNVQGSAIVGLSASQITSGLLNTAVLSTNGIWNVGGLTLTNVMFATGTLPTPTLAQVLAAGNDGGGQILTNVVLNIPAQGDLTMGSYTNQP